MIPRVILEDLMAISRPRDPLFRDKAEPIVCIWCVLGLLAMSVVEFAAVVWGYKALESITSAHLLFAGAALAATVASSLVAVHFRDSRTIRRGALVMLATWKVTLTVVAVPALYGVIA